MPLQSEYANRPTQAISATYSGQLEQLIHDFQGLSGDFRGLLVKVRGSQPQAGEQAGSYKAEPCLGSNIQVIRDLYHELRGHFSELNELI